MMELPMPVLAAKRLCWIVTGGLLAGAPALAQTPQERAWCEGEDAVSVDQRIDGCSAVIKAARDRSERLAETFNSRGIAYRLKGDYDRAIQDYSQAIKINPNFAAAFDNRCWARAVVGILKPALADCNEALRLMPNNAATLESRGFVFLKMSHFDAAVS